MTDKINKFVDTNIRWIVLVVAGILVLWLNSKYYSVSAAKEHETETDKRIDRLEKQHLIDSMLFTDLYDRVQKKVKLIDENKATIQDNKIKLVELETKTEMK